jgi:transketolase
MNKIATRKAYGSALTKLGAQNDNVVVLDAETSNSTYAAKFKEAFPNRFIESFIAEQNMVSMALGLSRMGKIPFVSTFAAFFTRAADQIRMSQYSDGNIKFVGSHAGVSIGQDGSSQMGLEDLSLFRCIFGSTVLYPSDSVSTEKLVQEMANHHGIAYMRTTRADTEVLYDESETFPIGGSKTLKESNDDVVTVIGAGITLHEALKAYEHLQGEGINIRVIDLYSIKPLDVEAIQKASSETKALIVVEDHYQEGGIYEAVCGSGANVDYQNGKATRFTHFVSAK